MAFGRAAAQFHKATMVMHNAWQPVQETVVLAAIIADQKENETIGLKVEFHALPSPPKEEDEAQVEGTQ
eukprot:11485551-Alexandrium_andersonii.AAC.1